MYSYYQPRRQRFRRSHKILITLCVIVAVLVGVDFGAKAFAEREAAVQIQKHGFPVRPSVSIAGFPFLTQVITRHFDQITVSSGAFPEGAISISRLVFVADNVHLSGNFQSGTAGPLNGTVTIGLGALGTFLQQAGPLASIIGAAGKLTVQPAGPGLLKGSFDLAGGLASVSATWRVEQSVSNGIDLRLVGSQNLPGTLQSAARNISVPIPQLPAGLQLNGGLDASGSGIVAHVHADHFSF